MAPEHGLSRTKRAERWALMEWILVRCRLQKKRPNHAARCLGASVNGVLKNDGGAPAIV
jgi:hypothetical protein